MHRTSVLTVTLRSEVAIGLRCDNCLDSQRLPFPDVTIVISRKCTCPLTVSLLIFVAYWRRNQEAVFYSQLGANMHVSVGNFILELVINYKLFANNGENKIMVVW